MRVFELAKELGKTSPQVVALLHQMGVRVTSHMSAVDPAIADRVRRECSGGALLHPPMPSPPPDAGAAGCPGGTAAPSTSPPSAAASAPRATPGVSAPTPAARPPSGLLVREGNVVRVRGPIVVREFAEKLGIRPNQLIAELMGMNVLASIHQTIDVAVACRVAAKHGLTVEQEKRADHRALPAARPPEAEAEDRAEDLVPRPPVVTFLGHVDHGKTSLLDRIRHTAVAQSEHGGITQHIGAYTVNVSGRTITFLDTPGHEAFTEMRARGANVTDIAVLVVAADDGVMPQTEEALSHARAARVAIMVAVNKIDLRTANPDRVLKQLQELGLTPEAWGGETICVPVSALTGQGVDHLLEMILLQADLLDLKANPKRRAEGFVLEGRLEPGMGPTATLLIKRGTLKIGDPIACGTCHGKVRALINDRGVKVKAVTPGLPVQCLGLSGVPDPGTEFRAYADERAARAAAAAAVATQKQKPVAPARKPSLEHLFQQLRSDRPLDLRVVVKADAGGSVEAIQHALGEIRSEKVKLDILHQGVGNVTVNDVMLAAASDALILGFHVANEPGVDAVAKREGVRIYLHQIIYELVDQVREAMTGLLKPIVRESVRGQAEVLQVFPLGKTGRVAGCRVTRGVVSTRFRVRVRRSNEVLYVGSILSLKRFRDAVTEVHEGQECGIRLDRDLEYQPGDMLECYEVEEIPQTL